MPDVLEAAAAAVTDAESVVAAGCRHLAHASADDGRVSVSKLDEHQVLAYDLAHAASAVEGCRVMLGYGQHGEFESMLARAFIADAIADLAARLLGREATWGIETAELGAALPFVEAHRSPAFLEEVAARLPADGTGPAHLGDEFDLVRETFHRFAADKIRPVAEHVHRTNDDIPEDVIARARRARRLRPLGPRAVRAASRSAASTTTSAWSSRPRSCRGDRSVSAAP